MKAITLWQPWASLLACGVIEYETRSWSTKYCGPMAIHAAASEPKNFVYQMSSTINSILGADNTIDYPRGAIIATANLIACHEIKEDNLGNIGFWRSNNGIWEFYSISKQQASLSDWQPGQYAWEFINMKMLDNPIPAKGAQRIWNWQGSNGK